MTSEAALSKYPQWTFCLPLTLRCWTACGFMLQVSSLYTDTLGPFYIQIYVSNPYVSKVQTHISLPSQFFYFDVYSVSTEPLHCPFACDSPLHPPHYNTLDQNPWGHPWCLYFYDTLQSTLQNICYWNLQNIPLTISHHHCQPLESKPPSFFNWITTLDKSPC